MGTSDMMHGIEIMANVNSQKIRIARGRTFAVVYVSRATN
jgi:hypothetical protein